MADLTVGSLQSRFLKHVLGPRGGLFALGVFIGMSIMHLYMTKNVVDKLEARVEKLEAANTAMNIKLQNIALNSLTGG